MKTILLFISIALASCAKQSPTVTQLFQPTTTITSVTKVNSGSNWTIRISYTLSSLSDVQDIHLTGSTYTILPLIPGTGTVYDNLSTIGMVQYNFTITMHDSSRVVTPLQTYNL